MGVAYRRIGGQQCYDRIEQAFTEMERLVEIGETSRIEKEFNLCTKIDLKEQLDIWSLFDTFGNSLAGVVQYHWPGSIEGVCEYINDPAQSDGMAGLASYIRYIMGGYCLGFKYEDTIRFYQDTQWGDPGAIWRQWFYQTCVDFGYYQSSGSPNQPFGSSFPVELYTQMCADAYDKSLTKERIEENIRWTNWKYNELTPQVTNVFFTQGDVDPWHPIGINEDLSESAPAFVIPDHSHCSDLYSASGRDTPEMTYAKQTIWNLVDKWLKQ